MNLVDGMFRMKKKFSVILLITFSLVPLMMFPKTARYMNVGYIDLEEIIQTYTVNYLETEIKLLQDSISLLQHTYNSNYLNLSELERNEIRNKLQDQNSKLNILRSNRYFWDMNGEIMDDIIFEAIQRDIMDAIEKISILEGYSLVFDKSGNFIYGSEDINLTNKVIFRLDEKLLNLQSSEADELLVF